MVGRIGFKNYKIRAIESVYIFNNIMDYCNGSLVGLPASTFGTLEFILHTEATVTLLKKESLCHDSAQNPAMVLFFTLGKIKNPHHGHEAADNLNP